METSADEVHERPADLEKYEQAQRRDDEPEPNEPPYGREQEQEADVKLNEESLQLLDESSADGAQGLPVRPTEEVDPPPTLARMEPRLGSPDRVSIGLESENSARTAASNQEAALLANREGRVATGACYEPRLGKGHGVS